MFLRLGTPPQNKMHAQTSTSPLRNVLLFILWKWNAVNMEINIWLFCLSRKRTAGWIPNKRSTCVWERERERERERGSFLGYVCVKEQTRHMWDKQHVCITPDNNYQWLWMIRLSSLFTQLQLQEMTNQYLILHRYLLCVEKPLVPISSTYSIHTESLCVLAAWINPGFSAVGGKKRENDHLLLLFFLTTKVNSLYNRGMHNLSHFICLKEKEAPCNMMRREKNPEQEAISSMNLCTQLASISKYKKDNSHIMKSLPCPLKNTNILTFKTSTSTLK